LFKVTVHDTEDGELLLEENYRAVSFISHRPPKETNAEEDGADAVVGLTAFGFHSDHELLGSLHWAMRVKERDCDNLTDIVFEDIP
jgi:hypothetical protein